MTRIMPTITRDRRACLCRVEAPQTGPRGRGRIRTAIKGHSPTGYAHPLRAFEWGELPEAKVAVGARTLLRPRTIAPKLGSFG